MAEHNEIARMELKRDRQEAKLELARQKRQARIDAGIDTRSAELDLDQLPTLYDPTDNSKIVDNENPDGLLEGRPWRPVP